jgi:hypothetical protein
MRFFVGGWLELKKVVWEILLTSLSGRYRLRSHPRCILAHRFTDGLVLSPTAGILNADLPSSLPGLESLWSSTYQSENYADLKTDDPRSVAV